MPDSELQLVQAIRPLAALYGDGGYVAGLRKMAEPSDSRTTSSQGVRTGRIPHPFDWDQLQEYTDANEYHSTCIRAYVNSVAGLGYVKPDEREKTDGPRERDLNSPVDKALNKLCDCSWRKTICEAVEDMKVCGNGFLEIVRRGVGNEITGVHHLPARQVYVNIENAQYERHYEIVGDVFDSSATGSRIFARFGDKDALLARNPGLQAEKNSVSEVIHLEVPTARYRWYGAPDWLGCIPVIMLVQFMRQHKFDFFQNRGVPEFMLFVLGQKLPDDDWKKLEAAVKAGVGLGQAYKSIAMNLSNPEVKIQLETLAEAEAAGVGEFESIESRGSLNIVSAHRTPPLLAGIQVAGKLGSNNELPNAVRFFDALVTGPAQELIQQTLGATLGSADAGLGLTMEDFTARRITDEFDMAMMDTSTRMRQTEEEAKATGRNVKNGLKD